jgi:Sec-independent protein secretion pathway component TatC
MVQIENIKFLNAENYAQFEHNGEAGTILSSPVIITQMISFLYENITKTNEQLKQT